MVEEINNDIQSNGRVHPKENFKTPQLSIDWKMVKKLCEIQCPIREICGFIEVSKDTLLRACNENFGMTPSEKFADWYEGGKCSLRRKQWLLADTSAAMGIFLGKQILKQIDDHSVNHKGEMMFKIVNYGDKESQQWVNQDAGDSEK